MHFNTKFVTKLRFSDFTIRRTMRTLSGRNPCFNKGIQVNYIMTLWLLSYRVTTCDVLQTIAKNDVPSRNGSNLFCNFASDDFLSQTYLAIQKKYVLCMLVFKLFLVTLQVLCA